MVGSAVNTHNPSFRETAITLISHLCYLGAAEAVDEAQPNYLPCKTREALEEQLQLLIPLAVQCYVLRGATLVGIKRFRDLLQRHLWTPLSPPVVIGDCVRCDTP